MGLIFLCLLAGINLQTWLGIAIPGSIIGLLILFGLMASGLVPVEWVKPSATLFIRYMILLVRPDQCRLDGALRYATGKPRPDPR